MNLKLCYITGWSLLVATGLSAQNRGDLAVKVARDSGQVIELTLQEAVDMARTNSPSAVSARHTFRSAYWSYRSFRANYLPSLTLSSNPDLTRTISKVTLGDGSEKYVSQNMLTVDGELSISQNVSLTGGSFFVQSSLQRMKLFDSNSVSFRSSPIIIGYSQSLFGYNSLRWDRRIEPVRYREAKKAYVESLELVSAETVNKFFALAQAQSNYDMARFNYNNADTLYKFVGLLRIHPDPGNFDIYPDFQNNIFIQTQIHTQSLTAVVHFNGSIHHVGRFVQPIDLQL